MTQKSILTQIADKAFASIATAYGLNRVASDKAEWGDVVVFQNDTTALRVYTEMHDQDVTVQLFRLGHQRLPPLRWGVDERAADPDNGFDVLDLISLRDRDNPLLADQTKGLDSRRLSLVLRRYGAFLAKHGGDVLRGDFTVFRELLRIVEKRHRARGPSPTPEP